MPDLPLAFSWSGVLDDENPNSAAEAEVVSSSPLM
jgi:hypothetical protein